MFTQTELLESLSYNDRNLQHVLSTILQHLITKKEIIKLNDLQEEWKRKQSTWSEWTAGLARKGA